MSKEILIKLFAILICSAVSALPQNYNTIILEPLCTDNESGRKLLVGESLNRNNKCVRIQCIGDENIWQYECHIPSLPGECEKIDGVNPHGMYPQCCPRYLCTKKTGTHNYIEKTTYDQYGNLLKTTVTQTMSLIRFDRSNSTKILNDVELKIMND